MPARWSGLGSWLRDRRSAYDPYFIRLLQFSNGETSHFESINGETEPQLQYLDNILALRAQDERNLEANLAVKKCEKLLLGNLDVVIVDELLVITEQLATMILHRQ
jgi:hypothetical protein